MVIYCCNKASEHISAHGTSMIIGLERQEIEINYCPWCGKKLE